VLLVNVIAEVGIVMTGGLVRLTGSGLGCPTWPECTDGSLVPLTTQPQGFHRFIEFGNRMLTFAVLVAALSALFVVLRPWLAQRLAWEKLGTPGRVRRPLLWLAVAGIAGIAAQAALGGLTVLLDLHPATVAAHFLLSMVMVAVAFLLYWRGGEDADSPVTVLVRRELRWLAWAIVALAAVVLTLGTVVTGAGPHSGDIDAAARFDLDVRMMSWLHADVVLVFVGLCVAFWLGARLTAAPPRAVRAGALVLGASALQGLIGYTQYFTGVPVGLVSLHMLGACLVWLGALGVLVTTRRRGT
jgi:cytochrome c oxidase assembly protein subunit 15